MTVYARSDVSCVSISPAHGGCGSAHSRPAPGGKPVELWSLTCNRGCEDLLRKDPLWAPTVSEVPETYDETIVREDNEKRGKLDAEKRALSVQNDTADALKLLAEHFKGGNAGIDVNSLAVAIAVAMKQVEAMPKGGMPEANQPVVQPVSPVEPEDAVPVDELDDLSYMDLKSLAARLGVRITRSRSAQLELIREHMRG